jgi:hypothetical protein
MPPSRPLWFLLNPYGWVVVLMGLVTAVLLEQPWFVLVGVVGYQLALLLDLVLGGSLGRTGAVRLARAEQENRELRAEQARLLGALRERDAPLASKANVEEPAPSPTQSPAGS